MRGRTNSRGASEFVCGAGGVFAGMGWSAPPCR